MTDASEKSLQMIVDFEVTSEAYYIKNYQRPTWPGGASGVTIGIGYDVGYTSKAKLHADWDGRIPAAMVTALEAAVGVTGMPAHALAEELKTIVSVPWAPANAVFRTRDVPSYSDDLRGSLPNTDLLSPDCFGALLSLVFNRGASFAKPGDRYKEMRAIKSDMAAKSFADIPAQIRSMKRLWPDTPGLRTRREKEAKLFEAGLAV